MTDKGYAEDILAAVDDLPEEAPQASALLIIRLNDQELYDTRFAGTPAQNIHDWLLLTQELRNKLAAQAGEEEASSILEQCSAQIFRGEPADIVFEDYEEEIRGIAEE